MNHDPHFDALIAKPPPRGRWRFPSLIEVLVTVGICALLIALLLPATRRACEAARRSQCVNNLKQIGIALQNYAEVYGTFPPASTTDAAGRRLHSWRTLILPYLEARDTYQKIDLAKPWDDPVNLVAGQAMPSAYGCPNLGKPGLTTYLAVVDPRAAFDPSGPRRRDGDQLYSRLAVIEASAQSAVPWMAPADADESSVLALGPSSKPAHPGGMHALFFDGSVQFIKAAAPIAQRRKLFLVGDRWAR